MKQLILLLWSVLPLWAFSQEITGTVKDTTGAAVSYASVTLRKTVGDTIVAFTTTGDDGSYHITLPANAGGLCLEVRSIGYRDQTKPAEGQKIDFRLNFSIGQLQDVVVTSKRPY